jgi:hypothetical protein
VKPLVINGKPVAPGTYTMFIDLKPNNWTLIVSNWNAQTRHDPKNTVEIWGAFAGAEPHVDWWRGAESNCRHRDFQSRALPTELPRRAGIAQIQLVS